LVVTWNNYRNSWHAGDVSGTKIRIFSQSPNYFPERANRLLLPMDELILYLSERYGR